MTSRHPARGEAPTLFLIAATYAVWALALFWLPSISLWLAVPVAGWAIAQHSSLTHEAIHGHPFRDARLNALTVLPPLSLVVPYGRFRDMHLAHHHDPILTDPYDDPESNYLDPEVWEGLAPWTKRLFRINNTLLGRMILGPWLGQVLWMRSDLARVREGDRAVARAWLWHLPPLALVLWVVVLSPMGLGGYFLAVWIGLALLKIRTFLEHRAHERASARTVVIEDGGPLALLFLNNNYHVVHHMHPDVPWYRLPGLYRKNREHYLGRNGGYRYRSYAEVFRRHLLRAKDPVPHPLWRR